MSDNLPPLVVMGVSGCGKSTVGTLLGQRLGRPFFDGDDFHPAANKQKMGDGIALRTPTGSRGWAGWGSCLQERPTAAQEFRLSSPAQP